MVIVSGRSGQPGGRGAGLYGVTSRCGIVVESASGWLPVVCQMRSDLECVLSRASKQW